MIKLIRIIKEAKIFGQDKVDINGLHIEHTETTSKGTQIYHVTLLGEPLEGIAGYKLSIYTNGDLRDPSSSDPSKTFVEIRCCPWNQSVTDTGNKNVVVLWKDSLEAYEKDEDSINDECVGKLKKIVNDYVDKVLKDLAPAQDR